MMPALQKNAAKPEPRYRPLGMIIAILATAFLYGIIPLVPVGMAGLISLEGHNLSGADLPFSGLDIAAGILILVICVMAWIGRPRWIRWVLIICVWLATAYDIERFVQALQPGSLNQGLSGGSLTELTQSALPCVIILLLGVPLYITWYMNRAPARAFYRRD
jgi:hypothetical protein